MRKISSCSSLLLPQACQHARLRRTRAVLSQHQPTQHAASGERRPEMYLESELRPVELECGRVHHAATYSFLKHASAQDCAEQGSCQVSINLHNMLRQVKEDRRCIFKASSDLLSLNAEEFIMQQSTSPQACQPGRVAVACLGVSWLRCV